MPHAKKLLFYPAVYTWILSCNDSGKKAPLWHNLACSNAMYNMGYCLELLGIFTT